MNTEQRIMEYVAKGMPKLTRMPEEQPANGKVKLPHPFSVPTEDQLNNFFYWDTYFINRVLIKLGDLVQVKNNLLNQKHLIDTLGFVPNADHLIDRSQPPLFTWGVYDYYNIAGDKESLKGYLQSAVKEHNFWMTERITPIGLNRGGCSTTDEELIPFCEYVLDRLRLNPGDFPDKVGTGRHLMAMAESGWDFTPRFDTDYALFACKDFVPLELNSILYDAELKIAELSGIIGDNSQKEKFLSFASERSVLMNKYLKNKDGIYLDYNYKTGKFSDIVSAASLYPFAFGISKDGKAALKTLSYLERDCGIAVCMDSKNPIVMQWDYPNMWAPVAYLAVLGLDRSGLKDDALRIAEKFVRNVESVFEKTGELWEKYNALENSIENLNSEYGTPTMLGFTAAGYIDIKEYIKVTVAKG